MMRRFLLSLLLVLLPMSDIMAQMSLREIHRERSLYRNIIVTEDSRRRCMRFTITRHDGQNQSCHFLDDPRELVFPYARMTLSSLLVKDEYERILIVGLGGGTLPEVYNELFPQAEIIANEIDEAVVRVAKDYFDFRENEQISVNVSDARVYVKRAGLRDETFDLVILDAFNGEYIPEHLMTTEFLEEVKTLLGDDGMVVANTFSTSRLYDAESVTYEQVFGEIISISMPGTGNRVIIASAEPLPDRETLVERVPEWRNRLRPYGMDLADYPEHMSTEADWNRDERALTDQYSPVNLLND